MLRALRSRQVHYLALGMLASPADARIGGGMSFGSRGTRTFTAPPMTQTAPNQAAPIKTSATTRSMITGGEVYPTFFGGTVTPIRRHPGERRPWSRLPVSVRLGPLAWRIR